MLTTSNSTNTTRGRSYLRRIIYPGDDDPWYCDQCQLGVDREKREAAEREEALRTARLPRMMKITRPGVCKDVTRVDGEAAEGLRLADPAESHLTAGVWVTKHTRGGGTGTGGGRGVGDPATFKVGDLVEAKWHYGWYGGHITAANDNGTFIVEFDDGSGDVDRKAKPKNMRMRVDL